MDLTLLGFQGTDLVAVLGAISVATERIVEIAKGWVPALNREYPPKTDPMIEARRRAYNQLAALAAALLVSIVVAIWRPGGPHSGWEVLQAAGEVLALAVLASGGSGFWNAILGAVGVFSRATPPPRPRAPLSRKKPPNTDPDESKDEI